MNKENRDEVFDYLLYLLGLQENCIYKIKS